MRKTWIYILLLILTSACYRTKPQSPSQRNGVQGGQEDTTLIAMMNATYLLCAEADRDVVAYIKQSEDTYAQLECGLWMRWQSRSGSGRMPEKDQTVNMHLAVRDLSNQLLMDSEQTLTVGHEFLPAALDKALEMMEIGDSVVMVCPWYVAYGQQGNENVKPYQNVIMEVQLR